MDDFLIVLALFLALVGVIALGLLIPPRPYRPHSQPSHPKGSTSLRPDLPAPVLHHFKETIGEAPPRIDTAVIWGRGRVHLRGVWAPMRFKTWYKPGYGYYRRIALTWFSRTLLRGSERYTAGQGRVAMLGRSDKGLRVDQNQALEFWSDLFWLPPTLVGEQSIESGAHWEPINEESARLVYPVGTQEDSLIAHFDPVTGRMTHLSALRLTDPDEEDSPLTPAEPIPNSTAPLNGEPEKEPWRLDFQEWKEFQIGDARLLIPWQVSESWGESGAPQAYWTVDGVVINVSVEDQL